MVEPHGLLASWVLTWFVHEFPNFEDSMLIFDFQLTELSCSSSSESAEILIGASLILLYKEKLIDWREDPFERVMFLRNLPKIAPVSEVIKCARLVKAVASEKDVVIIQAWMVLIVFLYIADRLTSVASWDCLVRMLSAANPPIYPKWWDRFRFR